MGEGQRKYEKEYKVQPVKLAKEIGAGKAAKELGIPLDTLFGWQKAVREGWLDAAREPHTRDGDKSGGGAEKNQPAAEERERVFGGGQRFFAASRRKLARNSE